MTPDQPIPIDELPADRFVEGWTAIVGEPPSIMLDRHREMIAVLVDTVPADPDDDVVTRGLRDDRPPATDAWLPPARSIPGGSFVRRRIRCGDRCPGRR